MLIVSIDASFVWDKHQTKSPHTADSLFGRHTHTLLELFKYISENPESSERLLRKLRATNQKKRPTLEALVY